jgi:hypothetical protein
MEEVYFVVKGFGMMRVDGDEVELRPGVFVRVDGESTRPDRVLGRVRVRDVRPPGERLRASSCR